MRFNIPKLFGIIILGFFMLSLVSPMHIESQDQNNLQTLISKIQALQNSTDSQDIIFSTIFTDALSTLKSVAGIQTVNVQENEADSKKSITFVVKTRTPYLLTSADQQKKAEHVQNIIHRKYNSSYQSYALTPEPPPPKIL